MTHSAILEATANSAENGQELAEFLQENNGHYSAMRAMSFIALIAAIGFGAITITSKNADGKYITTSFLVAAFAPKAVQKFAERP
ncbi:hypothetical protein QUB37_20600 [Microcoleus sp. AT3-A2]|uniref:hypothetical protein n=1 Tax=unclassified Microcoleus TaxID=2642155 RepID=UPI002FD19EE7